MAKPITANEEIRRVPATWKVKKTVSTGRVHYYHPQHAPNGTYIHPVLGKLPEWWEVHKSLIGYFYYNMKTGQMTNHRPEKGVELQSRSSRSSPHHRPLDKTPAVPRVLPDPAGPTKPILPHAKTTATGLPAVTTTPPPLPPPITAPPGFKLVEAGMKLERNDISESPLDSKYEVLKVIDTGDGTKGGMNAGVFIVRNRSTKELFIQKNFKFDDDFLIQLVKKEITILRNLKCNSLVQYVDGFMQDSPFEATVYMELCDCGDLGQLLSIYTNRKKSYLDSAENYVPESFIWHAFLALIDGLHYLATGSSYLALDLCSNDAATWRPLVHRDIKPDNIMLKSRSTPGSKKPLYVILTDFGMAEYESDSKASGPPWPVFGTPEYHAPELCFDPSPTTEEELDQLASPHSLKSDIWAVAAVMHALCERDVLAHMDRACWLSPSRELRWRGRAARKQVLQIQDRAVYSDRLQYCIRWAGHADPAKRPDVKTLVPRLKTHMDHWRVDPNWKAQSSVSCRLPDWAVERSNLV